MLPQTILFYGRSGCGKGTQAKLIIEFLEKSDPNRKTFYVETGAGARSLAKETSLIAKLTSKVINSGGLLPAFIPIWIWSDFFAKNITGNEHLIMDGLARRSSEAPILAEAFQFYERPTPIVCLINVSRQWAIEHLKGRARSDDNDADIARRLDWFDSNVAPAVDYFRKNSYCKFIDINGEQTIPQVHDEIIAKIGFK